MTERFPERLTESLADEVSKAYRFARRPLLLSDYDGTLVPFAERPELAAPDPQLLMLLESFAQNLRTHAFMISGRDKATLDGWFGDIGIGLIAEHGAWIRRTGSSWQLNMQLRTAWKDRFRALVRAYVEQNPRSLSEEKDFSLVWHYRRCDPELGELRAKELVDAVRELADGLDVEALEGNKVVEIRPRSMNKGLAAARVVTSLEPDFILAIGDDRTDEDMFRALPSHAVSIRVGTLASNARYQLADHRDVRNLLMRLADKNDRSLNLQ